MLGISSFQCKGLSQAHIYLLMATDNHVIQLANENTIVVTVPLRSL